jgi:hypothetical protein
MSIRAVLAEVRELLSFIWERKVWWMVPPVVALLIVALLVALGQGSALSPLIYPLF